MASQVALRGPGATALLIDVRRRHPEWWVAGLAAAAWIGLLAAATLGRANGHHAAPGVATWDRFLLGWIGMVSAMMLPIALPAVRYVAFTSFRSRRIRSIALFLLAQLAVWSVAGVVAFAAVWSLARWTALPGDVVLAGALAIAAVWQVTPVKRRALNACRRTVPLRPSGRPADLSCLQFGALQARRCVWSCWALMLVMAVAGHAGMLWMICLSALVIAEELLTSGRRLLVPSAAVLAALAVVVTL